MLLPHHLFHCSEIRFVMLGELLSIIWNDMGECFSPKYFHFGLLYFTFSDQNMRYLILDKGGMAEGRWMQIGY